MCRSIHVLRQADVPASPEDVTAAALQFVRKVSGYQKPSQANTEAFEAAVLEVAAATQRLLDHIQQTYPASSKRVNSQKHAAESSKPHRHGRGASAVVHMHD